MEKLSAILILCSIMVISVPAIHGIAQDPKSYHSTAGFVVQILEARDLPTRFFATSPAVPKLDQKTLWNAARVPHALYNAAQWFHALRCATTGAHAPPRARRSSHALHARVVRTLSTCALAAPLHATPPLSGLAPTCAELSCMSRAEPFRSTIVVVYYLLKQKLTKLHFYFHDIESGNNITSIQVARVPNNNSTSAAAFGGINVFDNAIIVGPNITSKQLDRAQGLFVASSLGPQSLLIAMNPFFTEGEFNGSTLAIVGRDPILDQYREISVVGGSGEFRLARGIATAKTFSFDTAANNTVVEYHVVVIHY
ncbi:hypothetical protein HYC85_013124 [Camellia sinensis]|uniref:Dirigent protein n=1 Tax=Camellia sinensis TaxID=4442 RepID=A0A7J7H3Q1_CAMSI|nr:hypothetical protein HYC85_013124 [Camellia sinensis]